MMSVIHGRRWVSLSSLCGESKDVRHSLVYNPSLAPFALGGGRDAALVKVNKGDVFERGEANDQRLAHGLWRLQELGDLRGRRVHRSRVLLHDQTMRLGIHGPLLGR